MKLFLLRHGEAGPPSRDDSDRQLTSRGVADVHDSLRQCRHRLPHLDTILSSPYTRARQTAAIVLEDLCLASSALVIDVGLEPGASVDSVTRLLASSGVDNLLVVGHQPLVGKLAAWLTDDPTLAGSFAPATLAALELDYLARGCARLSWQVHPSRQHPQ